MAGHRADRERLKVIRCGQWDPSWGSGGGLGWRGEPHSTAVPRLAPTPGRGREDRAKGEGQERQHSVPLTPVCYGIQGVCVTRQLLLSTDPVAS